MNDAISALQFVSPVERGTWLHCGMALQSEYGDEAKDAWIDWSRGAESFREASALSAWRSFKAGGKITIGTLYHYAQQHGWKPGPDHKEPSQAELQARQRARRERDRAEAKEIAERHAKAARRAVAMIASAGPAVHPYLAEKGFPDAMALVLGDVMIVPMMVGGAVSGVQTIELVNNAWVKKFLPGQRCSGATFTIGQRGRDWLCEGYATALSVHAALAALKMPYRIHCCFSAGNMVKVAKSLPACFVVADNDEKLAGQKAAEKIGRPFWISDVESDDFNDFSRRVGLFRASQALRGIR